MKNVYASDIISDMNIIDEALSDHDKSLMDGNRLDINKALQSINSAIRNLKKADDPNLRKIVKYLADAEALIIRYNKESLKLESRS